MLDEPLLRASAEPEPVPSAVSSLLAHAASVPKRAATSAVPIRVIQGESIE
jgi:hypothetical protein